MGKAQCHEHLLTCVHEGCLVVLGHRDDALPVLVTLDPVLQLHLLASGVVCKVISSLNYDSVSLLVLSGNRSCLSRALLQAGHPRREGLPVDTHGYSHFGRQLKAHSDLGALLYHTRAVTDVPLHQRRWPQLRMPAACSELRPSAARNRSSALQQRDDEACVSDLQLLQTLQHVRVSSLQRLAVREEVDGPVVPFLTTSLVEHVQGHYEAVDCIGDSAARRCYVEEAHAFQVWDVDQATPRHEDALVAILLKFVLCHRSTEQNDAHLMLRLKQKLLLHEGPCHAERHFCLGILDIVGDRLAHGAAHIHQQGCDILGTPRHAQGFARSGRLSDARFDS
mmetsp:Transcript_142765/g.259564  ORF Transcript_142765/g.259564 Transcript_142765/m.259564 type:complete len:337 (+) Transcript_142765:1361-2371(+)